MNDHKFSFHGEGGKLFGILIVNLLLTVLTLGIYYPWARAAVLQYLYKETELSGSRFTFHGTGKEMFKGFIKAYLIIIAVSVLQNVLKYNGFIVWASIISIVFFLAVVPFVIHASLRYRLSRTSWKGIHFGYRGNLKELYKVFYTGILFCIITIGIYAPWFTVKLRKYLYSNVRYGDVQFEYQGNGLDLFLINLKGYLLTFITLGIYGAWYFKDLFNYNLPNNALLQGEKKIHIQSTLKGGGLLSLFITNALIVIFTFGLGSAWAKIRLYKYIANNLTIDGEFDANAVTQTEEEYKDATGEDLGDMLDIGIV